MIEDEIEATVRIYETLSKHFPKKGVTVVLTTGTNVISLIDGDITAILRVNVERNAKTEGI